MSNRAGVKGREGRVRGAGVLLALAFWVLLWAGARADVALAGQQVRLDLWTIEEEPERMACIRYLMDAFMLFNPDVKVTVWDINENDLPGDMAQAVADGRAPEMVNSDSTQLAGFARRGWLDAELATRVVDSVGRDRFFAGALDLVRDNGTGNMSSIPFHGWVQGVWYRADWFEQAGLEPPATWEAMLKAARTLHDPDQGQYGILVGTKADAYATQIFSHLVLSAGAKLVDRRGRPDLDSPGMVRALEFYRQLARYGPPGENTWRARDYYIQGRLAMMFYSSFIMDDLALAQVAADSLGRSNFQGLHGAGFDPALVAKTRMVSLIDGGRPAGFGVLTGLGLAAGLSADKREAVLRLAEFLFRPDCYMTWLHMSPGGMMPVLRDVADLEKFHEDMQGVFRRFGRERMAEIVAGFERFGNLSVCRGRLCPVSAALQASGILGRAVQEAATGKATPAQALARAQREALRDLADVSGP